MGPTERLKGFETFRISHQDKEIKESRGGKRLKLK